jgi:hypothetical protein
MKSLLAIVTLVACGGGGGFPTDSPPEAPPVGGRFTLAWTVTDLASNPITCGQIGANFVTVTLRNRAIQGASTEVFSCNSAMATSLETFTPGTYDLTFELGGNSGVIGTAPAAVAVEITSGGTVTVDPIVFAVDATGKLELFLNSGVAGGNCAAGANINNFTITLTHTGAACEPVTFDISNGPPSSYGPADCANPPLSACIDNNQKLSVPSLPAGSYKVEVKGKIGGVDCFTNTQTIVVPPNSKTLMQTLGLTKQTTVGCPP